MVRKVVNTTKFPSTYNILSQTPSDYNSQNYFLKELQDKVNADWQYRPNRVNIEYENEWGEQTYSPIEVVIQTVKSENGVPISDDYKRIVFRDILERRFKIGNRFRFADFPYTGQNDSMKNVWISINTNTINFTSSMVVQRCNGSIGSVYQDSQGISHYHYEPVVQNGELMSPNFVYNETAVSPQSELIIFAQHNRFTKNYFINQRFIIGYDKVYRVKAINKFYGNSTFNPYDVGIVRLYLELTENSEYDDFSTRIAHQTNTNVPPVISGDTQDSGSDYVIAFTKPEEMPQSITETGTVFHPVLKDFGGSIIPGKTFTLETSLQNLPSSVSVSSYLSIEESNGDFTLKKIRTYLRGDLELTWTLPAEQSPSGEELSVSFQLSMRQ